MPQTFIVKFIPDVRTSGVPGQGCVIHRIEMPRFGDGGGFSREVSKWNGFAHGIRNGVSQADALLGRVKCNWSPGGLYYCLDFQEDHWIRKCEHDREFQVQMGRPERQDHVDERLFPTVVHQGMDDFFAHIGFDRKRRRYV